MTPKFRKNVIRSNDPVPLKSIIIRNKLTKNDKILIDWSIDWLQKQYIKRYSGNHIMWSPIISSVNMITLSLLSSFSKSYQMGSRLDQRKGNSLTVIRYGLAKCDYGVFSNVIKLCNYNKHRHCSDSQPGVCVSLGVRKKIPGGTLWVQFLSGVCKSTIRLRKANLLYNIVNSDFHFSVHPLEVVPFSEDHLYQRMAAPHSKQVRPCLVDYKKQKKYFHTFRSYFFRCNLYF